MTDWSVRHLEHSAKPNRDVILPAAKELAFGSRPCTFTGTLYGARIAALMDDRERALALLANALDESGRFRLPAIREYDELASLRRDRRFERLVALR